MTPQDGRGNRRRRTRRCSSSSSPAFQLVLFLQEVREVVGRLKSAEQRAIGERAGRPGRTGRLWAIRDSDLPVFVIRCGQSGTPVYLFIVIIVDEKQAQGTASTAAVTATPRSAKERFHPDSRYITWISLLVSEKHYHFQVFRCSVQPGGRKNRRFSRETVRRILRGTGRVHHCWKAKSTYFSSGFPASRLAVQYCCNGVSGSSIHVYFFRRADWLFNNGVSTAAHIFLFSHLHFSSNLTTDGNHRQEKQHLPRLVHHPEAPLRARKPSRKQAKPEQKMIPILSSLRRTRNGMAILQPPDPPVPPLF